MEKKRDVKSVFSKQHCELLADVISRSDQESVFDTMMDIAFMLKQDNPRFDVNEFINKCFPLEASK
jgi:hypothetical protein